MRTILLLYSISWLYAAGQPGASPALYTRLATYDSATTGSSFFINPARLAVARKISLSLYAEQRFLLAELALYQVTAAFPVSAGSCFGIGGSRFGGGGYRRSQLGLAYARSLGTRAALGARFHYAQQQTAGYGNAGSGYFELGTLIRVTDPLAVSLHAVQPVTSSAKDLQGGRPAGYSLGIGYRPSAAVLVVAEMIRAEGLPVSLHGAVQYRFERRLQASMGIDAANATFYLGAAAGLGWLTVEAVTALHPILGPSPALILSFQRR